MGEYKVLCWIITFNFINASWVFFRAENLQSALNILKGMVGINEVMMPSEVEIYIQKEIIQKWGIQFGIFLENISGSYNYKTSIILPFLAFVCLFTKNSLTISHQASLSLRWNLFCAFLCVLSLIQIYTLDYNPTFLYFNF